MTSNKPTDNQTQWNDEKFSELAALVEQNIKAIDKLVDKVDKLADESKEQSIKFAAYQQSTQSLVNLGFSLIASATIITVVGSVFMRR